MAAESDSAAASFDVDRVRADFPLLARAVNGQPVAYFDNAATAQKPQAVLDAVDHFYRQQNANVHRGIHEISQQATEAYEAARVTCQRFLNAASPSEIVFVRGTTEALNLVAQTCGRQRLSAGDNILVSAMEHHSNIVPWQLVAEQAGANLKVLPMNDRGELLVEQLDELIDERTRVLAVTHVSNVLGTVNPIQEITRVAHERGAIVVIDGAQAAPHGAIDVRELDCDFYTASGHKLFGPTGIGVLYGKADHLAAMPPWQGGGEMIRQVTFEKTTYADAPQKFEAGTPNIAGAVGMAAAIDYLEAISRETRQQHEQSLLDHALTELRKLDAVTVVGEPSERASLVSFNVEGFDAHDIGMIMDQEGIAIRTGHHCAQPTMDFFGVSSTARASFAFYNTHDEVDRMIGVLSSLVEM